MIGSMPCLGPTPPKKDRRKIRETGSEPATRFLAIPSELTYSPQRYCIGHVPAAFDAGAVISPLRPPLLLAKELATLDLLSRAVSSLSQA